MSKLHLATTKEFNYMAYIATMTALRTNQVVFWYHEEPETEWWKLVKGNRSIEINQIDPVTGITLDVDDNTGRLDIIYLRRFTKDSIDDAVLHHEGLFESKEIGEFEQKDLDLVRVHIPEGAGNLDFVTPEWVKSSGTMLAELIQTVCLKRIWNPYER